VPLLSLKASMMDAGVVEKEGFQLKFLGRSGTKIIVSPYWIYGRVGFSS
jgi:hypothetical protein